MTQKSVNSKQDQKKKKHIASANVLETLKDVGGTVAPAKDEIKTIAGSAYESVKEDLIKKAPQDIVEQLIGIKSSKKISGEIGKGEQLNMKDVFSGKREHQELQKKKAAHEKRYIQQEMVRVEQKSNELRMQLKVLTQEVVTLASTTTDLGKEIQVAAMQAPVEPGVYHIVFFEKLIDFIKSFRKKIEEASVWLHVSNSRAEKKNYWAKYKKHGAKFLLSGEHYLSRSAG